jgi:hypothetical protein
MLFFFLRPFSLHSSFTFLLRYLVISFFYVAQCLIQYRGWKSTGKIGEFDFVSWKGQTLFRSPKRPASLQIRHLKSAWSCPSTVTESLDVEAILSDFTFFFRPHDNCAGWSGGRTVSFHSVPFPLMTFSTHNPPSFVGFSFPSTQPFVTQTV